MIVGQAIEGVREILADWRKSGDTIGLVPTMGYFHDGHLKLMSESVARADKTVVSLFVNPAQFGPDEDLDVYPKDLQGDCDKARQAGVDVLFCPDAAEVYRPGHKTKVSVSKLTEGLCGLDRPDHFTGVATVVSKLFNIIQPDLAFFGEKDFQQLQVVKQLIKDLNFPVTVIGVPIVREPDGMAMSSRNAYLNSFERDEALVLYKALNLVRTETLRPEGLKQSDDLIKIGSELIATSSVCTIDYLSIVDEETLAPQPMVRGRCRVLGAIRVNERIRLIDNMALYE